ncbi:MAG: hypothetical protein NTV73_07765 [Hyphomicrobiales bacterium]|nr:hypothetical protein [Hyphomicrobiales bacterium]
MLGLGGGKTEPKPVVAPEGKILASELLAYCPKIIVKEAEGVLNRYAKGGEGDPAKLAYQVSISDSTRSCDRSTGMLAIKLALAGRVVPGPAGTPGTITLPIRIMVVQGGGDVVYNQVVSQQVSVGSQVQQFVISDSSVVVPIPADKTLQIFAGFDQGPKKKQQDEQAF